jgi:hypothetical protein
VVAPYFFESFDPEGKRLETVKVRSKEQKWSFGHNIPVAVANELH